MATKESNNKYQGAFREYITDLKTITPCTDCKKSFPHYIMEFDHARGTKLGNITVLVAKFGKKRLLEEIAKCDIVCANCHKIRTFNRRSTL